MPQQMRLRGGEVPAGGFGGGPEKRRFGGHGEGQLGGAACLDLGTARGRHGALTLKPNDVRRGGAWRGGAGAARLQGSPRRVAEPDAGAASCSGGGAG